MMKPVREHLGYHRLFIDHEPNGYSNKKKTNYIHKRIYSSLRNLPFLVGGS